MTGTFRYGDIVGVDHKGREFLAFVEDDEGEGVLRVRPLARNVTYFRIPKRDVNTHWRRGRGVAPTITEHGGIRYSR